MRLQGHICGIYEVENAVLYLRIGKGTSLTLRILRADNLAAVRNSSLRYWKPETECLADDLSPEQHVGDALDVGIIRGGKGWNSSISQCLMGGEGKRAP